MSLTYGCQQLVQRALSFESHGQSTLTERFQYSGSERLPKSRQKVAAVLPARKKRAKTTGISPAKRQRNEPPVLSGSIRPRAGAPPFARQSEVDSASSLKPTLEQPAHEADLAPNTDGTMEVEVVTEALASPVEVPADGSSTKISPVSARARFSAQPASPSVPNPFVVTPITSQESGLTATGDSDTQPLSTTIDMTPKSMPSCMPDTFSGNSDSDSEGENYEAARLRNIEANNRMLAELGLLGGGLSVSLAKPKPTAKPRQARKKQAPKPPVDSLPRRRSTRLVGQSSTAATPIYTEPESTEEWSAPVVPAIGEAFVTVAASAKAAATAYASNDHLLSSGKVTMLAGHKHDVYSIAECPLDLVVGAGKQGMVTFYPVEIGAAIAQHDEGRGSRALSPVLSVKVHSRWASEVQCLADSFNEEAQSFLLLTASDDRTLVASRFCLTSSMLESPAATLCPESRLDTIHSGGIFSMHERFGRVATCSKDGTMCLSTVTSAALRHDRTYDDFASGVLKCVRWQPTSVCKVLATAGNDGNITLFDCRSPAATGQVEGAHDGCANSVVFHPTDEHEFMSSGFDSVIRVWDLRNLKEPLSILHGHHKKGKSLNHPCYLRGQPLTIGNGTPYLYLYDAATSAVDRQSYVGFTPSSLHIHTSGRLVASSGKTALWVFDAGFI